MHMDIFTRRSLRHIRATYSKAAPQMVNMDEPPFLSVGTEVSAKFKGAFCEAKIRKISKSVKCKVQYSNGTSTFVTDDAVKGQLKVGATVNIKCSDKKELVPATIQKIQDFSEYTVVFNDGDIKCLKRTAICLKSGKYFSNSATPLRTTIIESCRVQTHKKSIGESGEEEALAMEKKDELPPHWDKDSLFGAHKMCISTDCEPIDSDNSDKESIEQKDHLVALLFKFMDDRGTPINQAPVINEKDVDLYKLFKVVNNCGGYNKVNKHKLWEFIAYKAGHEKESYISVKRCYEQYLHNFEDFYRKLGCTMMSHQIGERSRSRFSRSIIRNVYKALPSTSCATDKIKCAKNELNDKKNYNSDVIKKTAKAIKAEEKRVKNNEETSKKGDKKKEDIANSISRNRPSVKRNPEITETKDPVRNSKTKKELEEILKKEIKKEIDSEAVDDQIIEDKKLEKNIYMRNLFGKSMQKIIKKEKVVKEKSANTGLPGMRKLRGIKEQIKTVVKEIITPFKKSNRRVSHTQQDASNNENLDGEILKFTQSKTKEELPTKSRRVSVLSNLGDSVSVVQLTQPGLPVENLIKIKKEDGSEKKKTGRKKKDDKEEKAISNDIILTPVNIENVPFDKDTPVVVGDNLVVYYGNKEASTYEAKVISVCDIEGVKKYYVHYKGWNSRYDEWIDVMRIAYKTKDPEPGLEVDIADSSKSSPPEQKNVDLKKVPPTSSRTSSSVTPLRPNSNVKKSPFSSARPTRACTLTDRQLYNIDNSDLEGEFIVSEGSSKQYSRKKVIKLEPGVIIKTEPLDTDDQKKTQYPRIYPSKKVLMQRSAHLKPKSSVFKVHSNKFKEVDICKQALKQPFQPPSYSIKPNSDNENVEAQNENKIDGIQIELKIVPNHCLSPEVKSEKNDLEYFFESSKCGNGENRIKSEAFIIPTKSENSSIIYCPSSFQDEEQNQLKKVTDVISSSLDDKCYESIISGTYFDLNKIRSDMKGLMPSSTNSNNDISKKTESFILDQQIEIEVPKINEPVTDDVYELKESESCNFTISSVIEEKLCRSNIHDSPKLFNSKKPDELQRVFVPSAQKEVVEQNKSMIQFVPNSNIIYLFDNNIKIKVNDNLNIINEIENPIMINQSNNDSNEFQNVISEVMVNTPNIKEIEQNVQCVSDLQYEVLDLCMKPPESPPTNIFSIPKHYEPNDMIVEEGDDDEVYDESKLVKAENYKIENDYQKVSDLVVISEKHNSSNVQIDENIEAQSLPLLRPYLHTNIEIDFKSSSHVKIDISIPKDTDYESTTCRNKSIQYALVQRNNSSQNRLYMDNNDENTKSGFEFYPNSKLPSIEVREVIAEPSVNDKSKKFDFVVENVKDKYDKEKIMVLPELQCRKEIVDEDTLNNVLNKEYNCKSAEYDIHKPSTSKGFFDMIYQPGTSKDSFYETDTSSDAKNSVFEASQAVKNVIFDTNVPGQSSLFDPNIPSCSTKDFYDHNIPSTSKSNFYENSLPSTSKSFYNSEYDVNNVLNCKETIPGSPTGMSEKHYEQERKKALQTLYEEREAASAMCAMNQSFCRPMITLMGATKEEMEEYTNILKKDGAILDQQHLLFLAEISSKKLGNNNINEPSVTELLEREPETIVKKIAKPPEKIQFKRKISSHEQTSKRSKLSTATAPIPSVSHVENPDEEEEWKSILVKPVFPPEMISAQKQAELMDRLNDLRKVYATVKARLVVINRRKKKIDKRKREQANAARQAASSES